MSGSGDGGERGQGSKGGNGSGSRKQSFTKGYSSCHSTACVEQEQIRFMSSLYNHSSALWMSICKYLTEIFTY